MVTRIFHFVLLNDIFLNPLLNRIEQRLVFSQFGLLIPNTKTKLQSQNVSKCLKIYRARKKKVGRILENFSLGKNLVYDFGFKNENFKILVLVLIFLIIWY
jgi:hypothetical protein